jgi:MoxR-like ATPase
LAVDYQSRDDEREIVALRSDTDPATPEGEIVALAVDLVRASREHPDLRTGSSVRGAIDLVLVARRLAEIQDLALVRPGIDGVLRAAACLALSSKITVADPAEHQPEQVIIEMLSELLR